MARAQCSFPQGMEEQYLRFSQFRDLIFRLAVHLVSCLCGGGSNLLYFSAFTPEEGA